MSLEAGVQCRKTPTTKAIVFMLFENIFPNSKERDETNEELEGGKGGVRSQRHDERTVMRAL